MKAAVLHGPNDLRIEERPRPRPSRGEVLVRVAASGVCSSDVHRIRAGDVPHLPMVPGHEFSGNVVAAGEDGLEYLVGTRVAVYPLLWCGECSSCRRRVYECCENYGYHGSRADGGMAEFVVTRGSNVVPLPDGVTEEEGAMTEPAAVGLHALNRARLREGETVVVIGAGTIGLIVGQVARARGAGTVVMLDVQEEKLQAARQLGFEKVAHAEGPDVLEQIVAHCGGSGSEVVIEAVGRSSTYNLALDVAARGGRVVWMGNINADLNVPQDRVSSILRKQLSVFGTWNSSLFAPENEWSAIHRMVAERQVNLAHLISHRIKLDELPDAIEMMAENTEPYQKIMVTF